MDVQDFRQFAHHLMGALQTDAIYPGEHPRVSHAVRELYLQATSLLREGSIRVALADREFVVDDTPVPVKGDLLTSLANVLERHGVGKLIVEPGLQRWEASALVSTLNADEEEVRAAGGFREALAARDVHNIVAGPITLADGSEQAATGIGGSWELYSAGLGALHRLRSCIDDGVDPTALGEASRLAAEMCEAVNRQSDAFVLLQSLKKHDDYSYTHSLNVALLSVTMARRMELPAEVLQEVAMAALLHDIGKEMVPDEVLNKPGKLTPEEWEVMARHSADGAKMLMRTPGASDLAVIVAFEHQLAYEQDNPDHGRWPLHLISQLVCVADVYDALRSNRPYREAIPPERAMRIMEETAGESLDADIFAGFRRMLGYYPPGTVIELSDGRVGVSISANPDHVDCPRVLVVADADAVPIEPPLPLDLSLADTPDAVRSLDPDTAGVDPFDYI